MKNLLLFSTLLIATPSAYSQLTVKPTSAGADSFVYVNNEVLFVKQAVNLTKNPTTGQEASIYLRNDGQLIQDGTTSTNYGNGYLSVQQNTPDTNAWAYYYWCSPVGNPDADQPMTFGNNKNFGILSIYEDQNATPGIGINARQANSVSSKEGFTLPQLTISRRWIYTHPVPGTEAEGNYIRINNTNGAKAGFGFTMKGVNTGGIGSPAPPPNTNQIYEFRGRPNSGDFAIPVQGPVGTFPNVTARMTLSGNPYPSAMDMNKFFNDSDNSALGAIYYYDEDRTKMTHNYSGKPFGYGTWIANGVDPYTGGVPDPIGYPGIYTAAPFFIWNAAGGSTGTGNYGTSVNNKRFAPIGQGFMLVGNTSSSTDVNIKNSYRIFVPEGPSNYSVFQRPGTDVNDEINEGENAGPSLSTSTTWAIPDRRPPLLRIYAIFDEAMTRDLVLSFSDEATDGYDRGRDGLSPGGMATDAYFPVGNDNNRLPYVINSVKYEETKHIPIAFKIKNPTQIRLKVVEEINKPYEKVYLFDRQENTFKELNNATASGLTFNLPAGNFDNRFFIIFRKPNLRPESELEQMEVVKANVDLFQNNPAQKLEVKNPEGYTIKSALVYDMNGKLVIQENNLGTKNNYSFYTGNLSDGVYLVRLTTDQDVLIENKVIVHNK